MDKQKTIKARWGTINRLFIILVFFALFVLIFREFQTFRNSITFFNQSSYDYRVHEVQHEVDNRVEEITSVQAKIDSDFKESLRLVISDVDFFASEVVANAGENLTLDEKRALYINTIYEYDIREDNYLFFAMDLNGVSYLSGLTKNLEGTDISYLQDEITGRYFVLDMIDIINNSDDGSGYIDYYWIKEVGGEHLKKTSYIYYNEDVQLFIGTGIYEVDYIKLVQDELFSRISSYYDNPYDYVYVMDYEGNVIYHVFEDFDKDDLLSVETVNGDSFHEYVVEALIENETAVVEYYFEYNGEHQLRTAYVRRIEDWNMYIGRSFIYEDLIVEQQKYLDSVIIEYVIYNFAAVISIIVLVVVLKRAITKNFKDTEDVFKIQNERIIESSYRDQLTGIYNRRYFEEAMKSLCKNCDQVTAIMMDANGLKLINDAYGHEAGDELLVTITKVLKSVFHEGFHFRWGGDEFVIIMNHIKEDELKIRIEQFHKECKKKNVKNFTISASVGYAINQFDESNLYELINQAETMMYKNKVYESSSTKRQIIDNILHNLYNNFDFEEQHSQNVKSYALLIGARLKLDKKEMAKLRLAALLHDVGKIAVPSTILMKKGALNDKEYDEIRKHSEKGYRILAAYPELSEFGQFALTHHERYDGTGYPKGLKGEEIPLFSRIISVADAFDAMTSNRVYKKEMTTKEAIEELMSSKGKQFDPNIVDIFIKAIK